MSPVTNISRACQSGNLLNNFHSLRQCVVAPHTINLRWKSSAASKADEEINNVVEEPPIRYQTHFNHERRRRPEKTEAMPRIVMKKRDEVLNLYPTLEERLLELDPKLRDPELFKKINIGMSVHQPETDFELKKKRRAILLSLKKDKNVAKLANDHKLEIDISAVQKDWLTDVGPVHIRYLALHCGIFEHLFGPYAYFDAIVPLQVEYNYSAEEVTPVYRGNIIKPIEARTAPSVDFPSPADGLWTLVLTNPDGDLYKPDSECCHWMVTNIRGSDVSSGEELVPYLPPVPPRGLGYQRLVFLLYRQLRPIQHDHPVADPLDLRCRSFSTRDFYRQHEANITPVGLSWFNSDWDTSLPEYFHDTLGMKEPVFEYEFPPPYVRPEEHFPHRANFVAYTDRYRDPKATSEQLLLKRLKRLDPFQKEASRLPFPDAQPINHNLPSWRRQQIKEERLGWGRSRELYRADYLVDALSDDSALQRAATVEVDNEHAAKMGLDWQKIHVGKRKRKLIQEQLDLKETAERLERVAIAKLD